MPDAAEPEPQTPAPEPKPEPKSPDEGSADDRNLAAITHLSGIILWFVVPLIVWLVNRERPEKKYLNAEAKEALNFQITVGIGYIVSWILIVVFIGVILWWIVWALNLILCIVAAIQVSQRGSYRYPVILRLLK